MVKIAGDLPFEYSQRYQDLIKGLLGVDSLTFEQQKAVEQFEQRDQRLEEFLKNVGGGSGTLQSIVGTYSETVDYANMSPGEQQQTVSVSIPADTNFSYRCFWDINARVIQNLEAGKRCSLAGFGQFDEFVPGVGFETNWGYGDSVEVGSDWIALGAGNEYGAPQLGGHSSRVESVPDAFRGTDITFRHTFRFNTNSSGYSSSGYRKVSSVIIVIAFPS